MEIEGPNSESPKARADKFGLRIVDPLSTVTRKERRALLLVSMIAITLVKARVIPSKITALGIEFQKLDQQSLLSILALITGYFLIAFICLRR